MSFFLVSESGQASGWYCCWTYNVERGQEYSDLRTSSVSAESSNECKSTVRTHIDPMIKPTLSALRSGCVGVSSALGEGPAPDSREASVLAPLGSPLAVPLRGFSDNSSVPFLSLAPGPASAMSVSFSAWEGSSTVDVMLSATRLRGWRLRLPRRIATGLLQSRIVRRNFSRTCEIPPMGEVVGEAVLDLSRRGFD